MAKHVQHGEGEAARGILAFDCLETVHLLGRLNGRREDVGRNLRLVRSAVVSP
jgi:hypothetical protein